MDIKIIQNKLGSTFQVLRLREHTKASEKYIDVKIKSDDESTWEGSIPYYYRRTGLFIENEKELIKYLKKIKKHFLKKEINNFVKTERKRWNNELSGKEITKSFFDVLLNLKWNSIEKDLPNNPNWARRIQDIKEFGYTIATNTNMPINGSKKNGTHIKLIPIPKGGVSGYETMSPAFKSKVINALETINAFELSSANKQSLIPDHKFPEIRWDKHTRELNENLSNNKIKSKFQLLDNQRNLQKREICRKCFQTNKRGIIFGIEYFYKGTADWPKNIPKTGKNAEEGCKGCAWYDIQEWRKNLNKLLNKIK